MTRDSVEVSVVDDVAKLSTRALDEELQQLVRSGRTIDWRFLVRLEEFDRRRGWRDYGSLWQYCRRKLNLLEYAAYQRIEAVKVLQRFPRALEFLREGRLWMSSLVLLGEVMTVENAESLMQSAAGVSTAEVKKLVASFKAPRPNRAVLIRKMPEKAQPTPEPNCDGSAATVLASSATDSVASTLFATAASAQDSAPRPSSGSPSDTSTSTSVEKPTLRVVRRGESSPVASNQHLIRLFVDDEFVALLERAKDIVSHSVPSGDITAVVRHALAEVVKKHERRLAPTRKCRVNPWDPEQRDIPEALWREVMQRDHRKCVWEFEDGDFCASTWQVQVDHILARAKGGLTIASNVRVLCRRHNLEHARRTFGDAFVESKLRRRS